MRRLRFFLDANILVDAQSRDLFLRAAEAAVVDVRWSGDVLREMDQTLARMGIDEDRRSRLRRLLEAAFPGAMVDGYRAIEDNLELPDQDDRHVLAAAATAQCDVLVTENLRDFPDAACETFDLLPVNTDDALLLLVAEAGPALEGIVRRQIEALRRPAVTVAAFLERLSRNAPQAAMMIGAALGVVEYQRMLAEVLRSHSSDGPQEAVRQLLDSLRAEDWQEAYHLVDLTLRERLAPGAADSADAVSSALAELLDDALQGDGWGFATAWRPQAPDVELVKLVQGGEQPMIASTPQLVRGHLFFMRRTASHWVVTELDGADPGLTEGGGASDASE